MTLVGVDYFERVGIICDIVQNIAHLMLEKNMLYLEKVTMLLEDSCDRSFHLVSYLLSALTNNLMEILWDAREVLMPHLSSI